MIPTLNGWAVGCMIAAALINIAAKNEFDRKFATTYAYIALALFFAWSYWK